jgi:acetylornithine deacetylase/succinyl-diaminopimelate desuccinylase-like protein
MAPSSLSSSTHETPDAQALRDAVDAGLPTAIATLSRLVRMPSVSWDGFDFSHLHDSAEAIAELARGLGVFESVEVVQLPIAATGELGQPAVVASRPARNGRPTVLLYAHHDVQPPGDDADWQSLPFEPTLRGDRLYGRGAADDKAGVTTHLASIAALTEVAGEPDLGIVLYIEGEEEFGSRSLPAFLDHFRDTFSAADAIVVADSGNWSTDIPALTVGLRGAVAFNVRVSTLEHASHSGMFGGAVPDAMLAAIRMLATLWNDDGSVAVAGLTSRTAETPAYDEAQLRDETGLLPGVSPIGTGEILSRIWDQPAITVTGIDAPSVKNASNTLVPSVRLRVSARIAPGQRYEEYLELLQSHLRANVPFGAQLEFETPDLGHPFLVDTDGWAVEEAKATMAEAYGQDAVEMGAGGSIPFIADLVERFPGAQILITGVEDPDSRAHSPNESLHLGTFQKAILAETFLLARMNSRQTGSRA